MSDAECVIALVVDGFGFEQFSLQRLYMCMCFVAFHPEEDEDKGKPSDSSLICHQIHVQQVCASILRFSKF